MNKQEMFREGQSLWSEYVILNGYAWEPKENGLKKLSKLLDLKVSYIRKMINVFLEA